MNCDRCYKEIPDTQHYDIDIGVKLFLCKSCVDEYKDILSAFIAQKHPYYLTHDKPALPRGYPTREKIGDPVYKYNILERVSKKRLPPVHHALSDPVGQKPPGRKPTNIFSKLFYMLFFEKVDP